MKSTCGRFCQATSLVRLDAWAASCVLHVFLTSTDLCTYLISAVVHFFQHLFSCEHGTHCVSPSRLRHKSTLNICCVLFLIIFFTGSSMTKTEGRAFRIVHLTARGAGAEAWRLLRAEYAGSSGAHLGNMVREVVCPRDRRLVDVSAGKDFLTSLIEREIKVAAYEVASGDRISEAVSGDDHGSRAGCSKIDASIISSGTATQCRCVEAVDRRVKLCHAWTLSSKGRCRCKSELSVAAARARRVRANPPETKARAKAKARTRTSTRAMTETRTRNAMTGTMVSGKRYSRATVHIARSGATNVRIVEIDWLNRKMVLWPAFKNQNLKLRMPSDADSDGADLDSSSWCFAALNNPRGPAGTLLVNSGSDDHICQPDFSKEFPLKKSAGVALRDVQGNPLSHHGTRHVNLSVGTRGQRANIDFQVAHISDNILSLGKLLRNEFVFSLRREIIIVTQRRLFHYSCTRTA